MYSKGEGVAQDYKKAIRWYVLAAQQGHARAQFNMGVFYYVGETVPQDYSEAFKWYTFAAEQGHAGAQTNLGIMYSEGEGVPQNNLYAYMWANIGSMSGQKEAKGLRDFLSKNDKIRNREGTSSCEKMY